jgi:DNA-binding transcriptional MocR family regulator
VYQVVRNSSKPLGDQLVDELSNLIASGRLAEGSRLPSVRELSRRTGVSVYTAVTAFDRLQARGLVESRRGSGYFVVRHRKQAVIAGIEQGQPPSADPVLGFARSTFQPEDVVVPIGSGFLPASWFADAIPPSIVSKAVKGHALTGPAPVQGDPELRDLLVERLHLASVPAAARNLVVTFGASQAFDLIARSFLSPGDTVLVDDPGYFVLPTQLKGHRVNIVPVPTLADGTALETLEELARLHRPRMFFTQTQLRNPTGATASAANCHGILKLAEKYNFLIAEDHIFSDLGHPSTSLAQIDELERVFYVGSFTKVLCPGIRVGFIAAPERCLKQLIESKILTVLSGCALGEIIVREVLASGRYRKHIERLQNRLAKARALTLGMLRSAGLNVENPAVDGIFLWARLPMAVNAVQLAAEARADGILLAPGSMFSLSGRCDDYLRFNVAYGSHPLLKQFLERALQRCPAEL